MLTRYIDAGIVSQAAPTTPPTVVLTPAAPAAAPPAAGGTHAGITHVYTTKGGRQLYMHFVAVHGLKPRATYHYVVQSGGADAKPSPPQAFHALPDGTTATRINIYGDLGVYEWNAMEWLKADCGPDAGSSAVDAIVHMGDHAYNEGDDDERRADAYMNAFQPTLASCPWFPGK